MCTGGVISSGALALEEIISTSQSIASVKHSSLLFPGGQCTDTIEGAVPHSSEAGAGGGAAGGVLLLYDVSVTRGGGPQIIQSRHFPERIGINVYSHTACGRPVCVGAHTRRSRRVNSNSYKLSCET